MEKVLENLINMVPFLNSSFKLVFSLLVMVIFGVMDQEVRQGTGNGAAKKAELVKKVNDSIDQPGGLEWPTFINRGAADFIVSEGIDLIVFVGNKAGFLKQSNAG